LLDPVLKTLVTCKCR